MLILAQTLQMSLEYSSYLKWPLQITVNLVVGHRQCFCLEGCEIWMLFGLARLYKNRLDDWAKESWERLLHLTPLATKTTNGHLH